MTTVKLFESWKIAHKAIADMQQLATAGTVAREICDVALANMGISEITNPAYGDQFTYDEDDDITDPDVFDAAGMVDDVDNGNILKFSRYIELPPVYVVAVADNGNGQEGYTIFHDEAEAGARADKEANEENAAT